jgi:two-component system CheB/CheR fusion protein
VEQLVHLHGGSVTAHSDGPGQGSEFVVRLPLLAAERVAAARAAPLTPTAAPDGTSRRVLVVDDNADAASTLAMLLKIHGHAVQVAYSGAAALEAVGTFRPEVVLLDIGMPGLSGYEVAGRLRDRAESSAALVVAVSGYGQDLDRERTRAAGFDAHLVKPVSYQEVSELLAGLDRGAP